MQTSVQHIEHLLTHDALFAWDNKQRYAVTLFSELKQAKNKFNPYPANVENMVSS
jgi:hypothetical protein